MNHIINEGAYKKISPLTNRIYIYLEKVYYRYGNEKWVKKNMLRKQAESKQFKNKLLDKSFDELDTCFVNIANIYDRNNGGRSYRFLYVNDLKERIELFKWFDSL